MAIELERIWVHPALTEEFKLMREKIELRTGKKLDGGMPAVSLLAAKILKSYRLRETKKIEVNLEKKNGTQKVAVIYLP